MHVLTWVPEEEKSWPFFCPKRQLELTQFIKVILSWTLLTFAMTHVSQILRSASHINSQGCKYLILLCFSPDKSVHLSGLLGQIIQQTNDQNHLILFDGEWLVSGGWPVIFNFWVNLLRKIILKKKSDYYLL